MINIPELWQHKTTIKRGHYGLVDASAKLRILGELVNRALETAIFRGKLDEIIEQRQALGATRRGEALENGRRRREEKERLKAESESNGFVDGYHLNGENVLANNSIQNGDVGEKRIIEIEPSGQNDPLGRRLDFIMCAVSACQYISTKYLIGLFYLVVITFHFISF